MGLLNLDLGFNTGIGSALSGVVDGIIGFGSNILGGGGTSGIGPFADPSKYVDALSGNSGGFLDSLLKNPVPLLQTGLLTAAALGGGEEGGYGASKEYLDAQLQLQRDELAQRLELAKIQAGGAGAGAGAAIEVAKIGARNNALLMKEKALADDLSRKLDAIRGQPELMQNAVGMLGNALQQRGAAAQGGFNSMANIVAGARR